MKNHTPVALATALLLAGATAASAASISQSSPSNTMTLSNSQQTTAWNNLHTRNQQSAPSGFTASVGTKAPATLLLKPVPTKTASDVPALRSYDFATVNGKLLIVNPKDRMIADVITG
jgi:Protein of unknown function (DUF1236)